MERAGGEEAERLLTVIVPYRNRREYLGRSLRSIVAQGCRGEFDLILVDNGSDDGGAEICREVAQECGSECAVHIDTRAHCAVFINPRISRCTHSISPRSGRTVFLQSAHLLFKRLEFLKKISYTKKLVQEKYGEIL